MALKNFRLFPQTTIQRGTDYCLDYFQNRGLADFHVFSSALSGSVGFTKYDYLSFAFLEGVYVVVFVMWEFYYYLLVMRVAMLNPVISLESGKKQNKMSINVLPCDDTFAALSKIVFSRMHLVNYTDPFLFINIQTDKPQVQDKLNKILLSTFNDRLLPNSLRYEKANLGVMYVN